MVVYSTDNGALCVAIPVSLVTEEVSWTGKHTVTLGKQDGTLQTKRIDELKRIFGWDGIDFKALEEIDPENEMPFEVVGEHSEYQPEGEPEPITTFKIVFMNPPGGSTKMPEALDDTGKKQLFAKWGSKLKAHSGGKAAAPAPAAKAAPAKPTPPAKPASGGPPSRKSTSVTARTSSQDEVWAALVEANGGEDKADAEALGPMFYGAQDELFPGKDGNLTPAQWGAVADKLGV
jgi:hypothetical protein